MAQHVLKHHTVPLDDRVLKWLRDQQALPADVTAADAQAFLRALRRRYRTAGTIWLLAGRASAHTAAPTQMLAAALTLAERPGMTRKPRVIKRWHTALPAAKRLRKCDDFEANSFRV